MCVFVHTNGSNTSEPVYDRDRTESRERQGGALTCKVYVRSRSTVDILLTLCTVAQHRPAAVLPRVGSRGRRQDQLAVLILLNDAGHKDKELGSSYGLNGRVPLPAL